MANEIILPPDCLGFYCIPLIEWNCTLTLELLNQHSEFRPRIKPYLYYNVVKKGFDFGMLKLLVTVERDSLPQLVYILVKDRNLFITCSAGTDQGFLSRHAYMALYETMHYLRAQDYAKYDWFDFFNSGVRKSKFLDVICDRQGLDITLKQKYLGFWKKGDKLLDIALYKADSFREEATDQVAAPQDEVKARGYLLAASMYGGNTWHIPILVPYIGTYNKAKTDVRAYDCLITADDIIKDDWTKAQQKLNTICFRMAELAWLNDKQSWCNTGNANDDLVANRCEKVFKYWHKAYPYLAQENSSGKYLTIARGLLKGKPNKSRITRCNFRTERPTLCFRVRKYKGYYELNVLFSVGGNIFTLKMVSGGFFAVSNERPDEYYLWDNFQDLAVALFFRTYDYGLSVLDSHYDGAFVAFIEKLKLHYVFL